MIRAYRVLGRGRKSVNTIMGGCTGGIWMGLMRRQSTLNQIRTKGINRGGLYGFFVKGEAIAGTIEDSSASATDASVPPSSASTPPTSASESEAPKKTAKKVKQAKKSGKDSNSVERKVAKLSSKKRAMYEGRAKAKKQTLDEYIARRIEKKAEKKAKR